MKKSFLCLMVAATLTGVATADTTAVAVPYSQDWSNTSAIANDDWSAVPGWFGGYFTAPAATNTDPQTVTDDVTGATQDATLGATSGLTSGGVLVHENTYVTLQGSGSTRVPFLVLHVNTTGQTNLNLSFDVIRADTDPAPQQFVLQYCVGATGTFTNITSTYRANATSPSESFVVSVPAGALNQSVVRFRWLTTDATGSDAQLAIDNISIAEPTGDYLVNPTNLNFVGVDAATPGQDTVTINATNAVSITGSSYSGDSGFALTTTLPLNIGAGSSDDLTFTYTAPANNGASASGTFTLTTNGNPASFEVNVAATNVLETTIDAFRTAVEGGTHGTTVYKLSGIVNATTISNSGRNAISFQDLTNGSAATRGVWIDDPTATGKGSSVPAVGDSITVWGVGSVFANLVQLVPNRPYAITGSGTNITPRLVTATELGDATEGVLLRMNGVTLPEGTYGATAATLSATQGVDPVTVRIQANVLSPDIVIDGTNATRNILGIGSQNNTPYQIMPRSNSDLDSSSVYDWSMF